MSASCSHSRHQQSNDVSENSTIVDPELEVIETKLQLLCGGTPFITSPTPSYIMGLGAETTAATTSGCSASLGKSQESASLSFNTTTRLCEAMNLSSTPAELRRGDPGTITTSGQEFATLLGVGFYRVLSERWLQPRPAQRTPATFSSYEREMFTSRNHLSAASGSSAKPSPFHCTKPPQIALVDFIHRHIKYLNCSVECLACALVLLDRFHVKTGWAITQSNAHRLTSISLATAAKIRDDRYFSNKYYAQVAGISNREINRLEIEFLFALNWDTLIEQTDFAIEEDALLAAMGLCTATISTPASRSVAQVSRQKHDHPAIINNEHSSSSPLGGESSRHHSPNGPVHVPAVNSPSKSASISPGMKSRSLGTNKLHSASHGSLSQHNGIELSPSSSSPLLSVHAVTTSTATAHTVHSDDYVQRRQQAQLAYRQQQQREGGASSLMSSPTHHGHGSVNSSMIKSGSGDSLATPPSTRRPSATSMSPSHNQHHHHAPQQLHHNRTWSSSTAGSLNNRQQQHRGVNNPLHAVDHTPPPSLRLRNSMSMNSLADSVSDFGMYGSNNDLASMGGMGSPMTHSPVHRGHYHNHNGSSYNTPASANLTQQNSSLHSYSLGASGTSEVMLPTNATHVAPPTLNPLATMMSTSPVKAHHMAQPQHPQHAGSSLTSPRSVATAGAGDSSHSITVHLNPHHHQHSSTSRRHSSSSPPPAGAAASGHVQRQTSFRSTTTNVTGTVTSLGESTCSSLRSSPRMAATNTSSRRGSAFAATYSGHQNPILASVASGASHNQQQQLSGSSTSQPTTALHLTANEMAHSVSPLSGVSSSLCSPLNGSQRQGGATHSNTSSASYQPPQTVFTQQQQSSAGGAAYPNPEELLGIARCNTQPPLVTKAVVSPQSGANQQQLSPAQQQHHSDLL